MQQVTWNTDELFIKVHYKTEYSVVSSVFVARERLGVTARCLIKGDSRSL